MQKKNVLKLKDQVIRKRFRDKGANANFPEFLVLSQDVFQTLLEDGSNSAYSDGKTHVFGGNICLILYNEILYFKWFYEYQLEQGECDESIKSVYNRYKSSRRSEPQAVSTADPSSSFDSASDI